MGLFNLGCLSNVPTYPRLASNTMSIFEMDHFKIVSDPEKFPHVSPLLIDLKKKKIYVLDFPWADLN